MAKSELKPLSDAQLMEELLKYARCRSPEKVSAAARAHFGDVVGATSASLRELRSLRGMDRDAARLFRLIGEISGRVVAGSEAHSVVTCPAQAARLLAPKLLALENEGLYCLCLDKLWRPADCTLISEGDKTQTPPESYGVYRVARSAGSRAVILAHNHPPEAPDPSAEDVRLTVDLAKALKDAGVTLVDHIIVSDAGYVSLAESGILTADDPLRAKYLAKN